MSFSVKYILTILLLGLPMVQAQELKKVEPPKGFEEGTQTRLTAAQLKDLAPWATSSMTRLQEMLKETTNKNGPRTLQALLNGFEKIRNESNDKRSEILMRFVLNRGLKMAELLKDTVKVDNKLAQDVIVRILKRSAEMALEYYESEYEFVGGVSRPRNLDDRDIDYSSFAVDYVVFLMTIMESMPDISGQYTLARLALGLFQFDLYRDINRRQMSAPAIMKIQPLIEKYPETVDEDSSKYLLDLIEIRKAFLDGVSFMIDPKNFMNLKLKFASLGQKETIAQRKIRVGDRVITTKGHWGTVIGTRGEDLKVHIDYNPKMLAVEEEKYFSPTELYRKLDPNEDYQGYKVGTKRLDYQCEEFEIMEVFTNGMIRAYYKQHDKMSAALIIYPDGVPYSVRFDKRGRECDR